MAGLEQPALDAILSAARIRRIPARNNIITGGEQATHLFLLQQGGAQYYHLTQEGESIVLAGLIPGDILGLVTLLQSPSSYMATAEATSDCELLSWERSAICRLAASHPLLRENGLRIALDYLKIYTERHIGLVTKTAEARLASTLLKLGDETGEIHPDGIKINATNDQLGALADTSSFTASRVLSNWMRAGILSKKRGRVLLHSPEALMIG